MEVILRFVLVILVSCCVSRAEILSNELLEDEPQDASYWWKQADDELAAFVSMSQNKQRAKRIVLFIGDGMGVSTVTAARIFKGQQEGKGRDEAQKTLPFEQFPNSGLIRTYSYDYEVTDSSAAATAIYSGVKVNSGTVGVNANVPRGNCKKSLDPNNKLVNIFELAQKAGMATGIVSTASITDATPACVYSHSGERKWQCDSDVPSKARRQGCKDIALQLIEGKVGKRMKVILGGGRQQFEPKKLTPDLTDASEFSSTCVRKDGRNLTQEWIHDKQINNRTNCFATNTQGIRDCASSKPEYTLGLFANAHMKYEGSRKTGPDGQPSLSEMTKTAIELLSNKTDSFLLLVESGRIDHGHHATQARRALEETVQLGEAVKVAQDTLARLGSTNETLVIVTADHSHSFTLGGYPKRGVNILGLASKLASDRLPYTTLMYSAGRGFKINVTNGVASRPNLTNVDTTGRNYIQTAAVPSSKGIHGGEDVPVYATGNTFGPSDGGRCTPIARNQSFH